MAFTMTLEGHTPRRRKGATEPRWSPDGSQIFFVNCKKVDAGRDCHIHRAAAPH